MPSANDMILTRLLDLGKILNQPREMSDIIREIMTTAAEAANADGLFFFEISADKYMSLNYARISSLQTQKSGAFENTRFFPPVYMPDIRSKMAKRPAEICACNREIINYDNIYAATELDTSFIARFDEENNYATVSVLDIPLIDRKDNLLGVAQFINARNNAGKVIAFTSEIQNMLISICNLITISLENRISEANYKQLLESFIEVLARAIDAKSPYTGSHCQKVPIITRLLATAAVEQKEGALKDFELNADDWYALHIASWLHDCGKITTPEYIVDKATKLETICNRIHEIRNRFEILRRDAHILYLQKRLANTDNKENLQAEFVARVKQLEEDFAFVAECNKGDNELSPADLKRLDKISEQHFVRYFNRMLGLSWAERNRVKDPELYARPAEEMLLQDRPDQMIEHYNRGELYNLKIPQGTISKEERQKINEHIEVTINMLEALPFPKELSHIVEYAGCHHERIDGKGYPRGLKGDQMSVPAKIMAIADVFEALTARDRPYKEPKKLSEVLSIMRDMKNSGHLDPDLYEVFIKSRVYMDYAEQYIEKSQIDEINPEEYL